MSDEIVFGIENHSGTWPSYLADHLSMGLIEEVGALGLMKLTRTVKWTPFT